MVNLRALAEAADAAAQAVPQTVEEAHAEAMARGARCRECPLWGCGRGPVMGTVVPGASLAVVGEAPGETEVDTGAPFQGWSGTVLETSLLLGGLPRSQVTLTNTILCQPPGSGSYLEMTEALELAWVRAGRPEPKPLHPREACAGRLARDLEESGSKVLLAVGAQALSASAEWLGVKTLSLKKQHGAPVIAPDGRVLMSSYHPAMAARGKREYLDVIRNNLTRAAVVAADDGRIPWAEPPFRINPPIEEIESWCRMLVERGAEVAVDLETGPSRPGRKDGADPHVNVVRCVGLATRLDDEEQVMVVPFRNMDGSDWWADPQHKLRAALALRSVMDANPLVFQNGQFDVTVMLRVGLMTAVGKRWVDTMIQHHDTQDNDLPHDLGFIARRYFCLPMWKADVDHKSVNNLDFETLEHYNARDVLVTLRCAQRLREVIDEAGTWAQYQTDETILPILQQMGSLGLFIDEEMRGKLSRSLNYKVTRELAYLRKILGKPAFNPRSVPALKKLLYVEWGYAPPSLADNDNEDLDDHSTDPLEAAPPSAEAEERAAEDAEEGSTNIGAILDIMNRPSVDPGHAEALRSLLEFRAWDKLRSTYIDNLKVSDPPVEFQTQRLPAVRARRWLDGRYQMVETLPERWSISRLRTTYQAHIIPTGRLSTKPAIQNWPAIGKLNVRKMVRPPPGHVLVEADFAQIEGRLYAIAAGDEALLETIRLGKDLHSMNAAALLAKDDSDIERCYQMIEHGEGVEPKAAKMFRKYWRTVAKRFCIAAGELVLTDQGCVPIERVTQQMALWDGVAWVAHTGRIYQGTRRVVWWDGLWATPDHRVWLRDGRLVQFGYAAALQLPLQGALSYVQQTDESAEEEILAGPPHHDRRGHQDRRHSAVAAEASGVLPSAGPGRSRDSIRPVDDNWSCVAGRKPSESACPVCGRELQDGDRRALRQSRVWKVDALSCLRESPLEHSTVAAGPTQSSTAALSERVSSQLPPLRSARHRVQIQFTRSGGVVGYGASRAQPRGLPGPHRQRRTLRAWQSALGRWAHERLESSECCASCRLELGAGAVALGREDSACEAIRWNDPRRDSRRGSSTRANQQERREARRSLVRRAKVYDLTNAGPRQRFVASGRLVHNCFLVVYGGEEEKLFQVMSTQRDKITGELDFPGLRRSDVAKWLANWHRTHPWTRIWHEKCHALCRAQGFIAVPALDERHRFFIDGPSKKNAVPNMTIQGFAGSIANRALIRLEKAVPFGSWSPWTGIVLQVHDCLGLYVPEARAEEAKRILEEAMYFEVGGIPIPAEATISDRWS